MSTLLERLGRVSARHPWRMLTVWLLGVVVVLLLASSAGGKPVDNFRLPHSDAQRAADILDKSFPSETGASAVLVLRDAHPPRDAAGDATTARVFTAISRLPHVERVDAPLRSRDGTIERVEVRYDRDIADLSHGDWSRLDTAVEPLRHHGNRAEIGGELAAAWERPGGRGGEAIGILIAVVVLLVLFGSVLAMLMPIGLGIVTIVVGNLLVLLLAAATDVPTSSQSIATMIGLGVAIDYSVFIVSRFRDRRARGDDVVTAAGRSVATSGRAVLFAGLTVVVAISGLALSGIWAVGLIGISAAIVVVVAIIAALTLLPAMLGVLGRRVDHRLRARRAHPEVVSRRSRRWASAVVRHPVFATTAALVVMLTLAVPLLSLRLGQTDAGTQPADTGQRRAFDLLAEGFGPGFNGPLAIVVDSKHPLANPDLASMTDAVAHADGVARVEQPIHNDDGTVALFEAFPTSAPHAAETARLVSHLRHDVLPPLAHASKTEVLVTGITAANVDLAKQMGDRLPSIVATVIALAFALLMIAFRSLVVPLKAALMNVLSIAAGYGVVVAVFQWGWGKGLVGLHETVPIVSWVPMLMWAILFGLSMDYEVFLLSSIREAWTRTGDTPSAIVDGVARTARVITAAAVIMLGVFGSFVFDPDPVVKMVGLGLAVSVLVDATVVRMLLVPATMTLLGNANWWLPRWLDRLLPDLDVEGRAFEDAAAEHLAPVTVGDEEARELVGSGR